MPLLLCPSLLSFYLVACVEFPTVVVVVGIDVEVAVPLEPACGVVAPVGICMKGVAPSPLLQGATRRPTFES